MNSRIAHIASNTFREAVRDRVLYNLIGFALLLSGAAILVGQMHPHARHVLTQAAERELQAAVQELARQFAQIPRAGDQVYGFAAGLYPTDAPTLPDRADGPADVTPA